jgi:hypothetical protein
MIKEVEEDLLVSKHNRIIRQESEDFVQIYNPPLLYKEHPLGRKLRDKKINFIIKKVRKKRK